jgi:uncharacterized protein YndB with AHSA1/START domain
VPVTRRQRVIQARPNRVWKLIEDPHHMPRWWPDVRRMEGVEGDRFTQVLYTRKGRPVRMDFRLVVSEPPVRRVWEQELAGTPFERVLSQAVTEVQLEPAGKGTQVTIVLTQRLKGLSRTGGFMFRRATRKKLDEALDGLARVC